MRHRALKHLTMYYSGQAAECSVGPIKSVTRKLTDIFHPGELDAQSRYNSRTAWSDRAIGAVEHMYKQAIDDETAFFVEGRQFFFIATADSNGNCDCSFRGSEQDETGKQQLAVFVENPKVVVFPDYSGNKMYNSLGNILVNPHIGMLFLDFPTASRLRINGVAEIIEDPATYKHKWSTAKRYVQVTVEQVFWNCSKRIPKSP